LTKQAGQRIKKTSLYVHSSLALTINLLALLTSHPFSLFPKDLYATLYLTYFLVSLISTYRYFYNFRQYAFHDFEDLYVHLKGGMTPVQID